MIELCLLVSIFLNCALMSSLLVATLEISHLYVRMTKARNLSTDVHSKLTWMRTMISKSDFGTTPDDLRRSYLVVLRYWEIMSRELNELSNSNRNSKE